MAPTLFVFDMGDVVIMERHVWHDVFSRFSINVDNIRDIGANATKAVQLALVGKTSEKEFWNMVEKDAGKLPDWKGVLESSYSCHPIDGTIAIIEMLKSKGCRVVCGTNNILPFYNAINAAGYYNLFPKVYSSFKIGISKPDPEFWRYIAAEENVNLSDMFFTDDNAANIKAATSLGIKAHQFKDPDGLKHFIEELGISL